MAMSNTEKQAAFRARKEEKIKELTTENEALQKELEKAKKKIATLERKLALLSPK